MKSGTLFFCLAIASGTGAINITSPPSGSPWTTSGPNAITWVVEAGDSQYFNIQLLQNNSTTFTPVPNLLPANGTFATGVDASSLYMQLTPSCIHGAALPSGSGFSIQFYTEDLSENVTIIANSSGTFEIVSAPATACTSGAISSATASAAANASSSHHHPGSVIAGIIAAIIVSALLVAGLLLYKRHRERQRVRQTQHFAMQKGLPAGRPTGFAG